MRTKLAALAAGAMLLGTFTSAQEPQIDNQAQVTLVGCVETEQAYRVRTGGAPGSASEFVLSRATALAGTPTSPAGDYTVTGNLKTQMATQIGHRVEIVGIVENAAPPSGGTQALRRVNILSWHPAGVCTS